MTFANFYAGIVILGYYCESDGHSLAAEHDEFFVLPDKEVSETDSKSLDTLGWSRDEKADGAWRAFV